MTPLEAAKRMADQGSTCVFDYRDPEPDAACVYCDGCHRLSESGYVFRHESDCPSLALPQIVAALQGEPS